MIEVKGRASLDGTGWESGIRKIEGSSNRLAAHLGGSIKGKLAAAFSAAAIVALSKSTLDFAGNLVDTSKRLDTTIEQLQVMREAAKENSTEFDKVATAIEKINILREAALGDGKEAAKALENAKRLGVSKDDLKNQTAANILTGPIARKVSSTPIADISKEMKEVFGKSFGDLVPFLKEDFEEVGAKLKKLGSIMDSETAVKLDFLGDELTLVSQILVTQAAPAILSFTDWVLLAIGKLKGAASFWDRLTFELNQKFPGSNVSTTEAVAMHTAFSSLTPERTDAIANAKAGVDFDPNLNGVGQFGSNPEVLRKWAEAETAAADAGLNAIGNWSEVIDSLKKKLAEDAAKLDHPKPPAVFPADTKGEEKKKAIPVSVPSDNLVKVGNFLGSSGSNTITAIGQKQVSLLQQIVKNTAKPVWLSDGWSQYVP